MGQAAPQTRTVLGYRLAHLTLEAASDWCLDALREPTPKLVVTLNPEIIVQAKHDPALQGALRAADLTVADGIGVLWAARQFEVTLPQRIPGVELMMRLLERGGAGLRVYFLGARPGVAERAAKMASIRFGTEIAGVQHGYFKRPDEVAEVVRAVAASKPDLLVAGLGEGQELFLHEYRHDLKVPVMIGVGGAIDVLAGEAKRTPSWTRRLGVEWAWRVGLDRKRWHRFPRLMAFVRLVRQEKRLNRQAKMMETR